MDMTQKSRLIEEINREISNCARCKSGPGTGTTPVFPRGNPDASCMLIGEGPGEQEELEQRPFVGAAGKLLEKTLLELGYEVERDFYITNIVKYRSFKDLTGGKRANKPPTVAQITAGRDILEREISIVSPKLVVALGAKASQWFLGKDFRLTQDRGKFYDWRGLIVLPTYHPAAILRAYTGEGRDRLENFRADLEKIKEIVRPGKAA